MTSSTVVRERRQLAPPWRARPTAHPELRAWGSTILTATARGYLAFVGTLLAVALIPLFCSWSSYVVRSGSMEPTVMTGDVIVAAPFAATAEVPLGRIMVYDDPSTPGRVLVHRVIAENDDGTYTTAGDANRKWDSAPLAKSAILGQGRLRVPWVGLPVVWFARHEFLRLFAAAVVTALALVIAARDARRRRRRPPPDTEVLDSVEPCADGAPSPEPSTGRLAAHVSVIGAFIVASLMVGTASAVFSAETVNPGNAWAVSTRILLPYKTNVLADSPWGYYETEEASGGTATDSSGNGRNGSYGGTVTYRQTGALTRVPGYSVLLGSNARLIAGTTTISNPTTFSAELWFKTSTTSGGKLVGFENSRNQSSGTYDRHVFMRNDGRLVYGGWSSGGTTTITTAASYNDGKWHHMIVTARPISGSTLQSSNLYVDGARVATGSTTAVSSYSGYWRAGYGNLPSVTGAPSSPAFEGNIDNFAVYTSELSATRVEIHYASR